MTDHFLFFLGNSDLTSINVNIVLEQVEYSYYVISQDMKTKTKTFDLSPWRGHLDVDIVSLSKENLSFHDVVEVTERIFRAVHDGQNAPKAIIGSGNAIIDGLIARTVGLRTIPLIRIRRHHNYRVQK